MWLLILAGLLATSVGKEIVTPNAAEKSAEDVVLLEIDVKEPAKRSPVAASGVYGASPSQFIIRHGDDAQELSPEYLALVEQYTSAQQQQYATLPRTGPPPRRPQPGYARQQQQLQQAYQDQRVPVVPPPRPRVALHPQADARAEAQAEYQAAIEAHQRAEAQARLRASGTQQAEYQVPAAYADPKLGTFEQELLQLVTANQAQELKLQQAQRLQQRPQQAYPQYAQQSIGYAQEYVKPTAEPVQEIPEQQQYHVETTQPRYPQNVPVNYQQAEEEVQYQQPAHPQYVQPRKPYRPAPSHYVPDPSQVQAEADAVVRAQANAEAQALAFQKITQASHNKHQEAAFEQIRIVEDRYKQQQQQSAIEQINQGTQVSEAGKEHIEEQVRPKDPEAAYRARVKAHAAAEAAEARRAQEAAEYKAHGDAIIALQKQQQAHLKAQEDATIYALNFEKNHAKAQAQAQAIANAQALALWKSHQANRARAQKEAQLAARAQQDARKRDPDNTPVVQYLLPSPNSSPIPSPNNYITQDIHKYQASGSSYVPRSAPRPDEPVNQPRQAHKHKIPSNSQIYVSQSGLLKKAPVKSLTIEEIIEQDQINSPQIIRIPAAKAQPLTQADLDALIQAGYTVTPVPDVARPTQQSYVENSTGYYVKKQSGSSRPESYVAYDDVAPRQRRPTRKQRPILKQESESEGSAKVTYLVPVEPAYGTRRPPTHQRRLVAEE